MAEHTPSVIDQFYKFVGEKKLMAVKCNNCGILSIPPRPLCKNCLSNEFSWVKIKNQGRLLTYTIIHFAAPNFQSDTPYAFGIVELEHKLRLPGMIKNIQFEDLKINMKLEIDFDVHITDSWPKWPRYYFTPS